MRPIPLGLALGAGVTVPGDGCAQSRCPQVVAAGDSGRDARVRGGLRLLRADLNPAAAFPLLLLSCPGIPGALFTPSPTPQLNCRLCPRRGPGANPGGALATEAPVT